MASAIRARGPWPKDLAGRERSGTNGGRKLSPSGRTPNSGAAATLPERGRGFQPRGSITHSPLRGGIKGGGTATHTVPAARPPPPAGPSPQGGGHTPHGSIVSF